MPNDILEAYIDESCQTNHRYLILGGLLLDQQDLVQLEQKIAAIRARHKMCGEVKWTKVSKSKWDAYAEILSCLFEFLADGRVHFHALIADTQEFEVVSPVVV